MSRTSKTLAGTTLGSVTDKAACPTAEGKTQRRNQGLRTTAMSRTENFDISFKEGLVEGWVFGVPEAYKQNLDIIYLRNVDVERSMELRRRQPPNAKGIQWTIFRMEWSRGEPPLLSFATGQTFYDPPTAYRMALPVAPKSLRRSVKVTEAEPDKFPGSGWVKAELIYYEHGDVVLTEEHSLSQLEFEAFLRSGQLPTSDQVQSEPSATAVRIA